MTTPMQSQIPQTPTQQYGGYGGGYGGYNPFAGGQQFGGYGGMQNPFAGGYGGMGGGYGGNPFAGGYGGGYGGMGGGYGGFPQQFAQQPPMQYGGGYGGRRGGFGGGYGGGFGGMPNPYAGGYGGGFGGGYGGFNPYAGGQQFGGYGGIGGGYGGMQNPFAAAQQYQQYQQQFQSPEPQRLRDMMVRMPMSNAPGSGLGGMLSPNDPMYGMPSAPPSLRPREAGDTDQDFTRHRQELQDWERKTGMTADQWYAKRDAAVDWRNKQAANAPQAPQPTPQEAVSAPVQQPINFYGPMAGLGSLFSQYQQMPQEARIQAMVASGQIQPPPETGKVRAPNADMYQ